MFIDRANLQRDMETHWGDHAKYHAPSQRNEIINFVVHDPQKKVSGEKEGTKQYPVYEFDIPQLRVLN